MPCNVFPNLLKAVGPQYKYISKHRFVQQLHGQAHKGLLRYQLVFLPVRWTQQHYLS